LNSISSTGNIAENSFIAVKGGIITEVSSAFASITEYSTHELLNKNIVDILNILRVGPNVNFEGIDSGADYFLFTKSLEVRFAYIEIKKQEDKQVYVFREKPHSRLEDKFTYLYTQISENVTGVSIFSVPDLRLLNASQLALDALGAPHNTPESAYGRPIWDLIEGWEGSHSEYIWKDIYKTGKAKYAKEFQYKTSNRGVKYWDIILTPVKEDGRIKYVVANIQDVTERVIYRQQIEEKNRVIEEQKKHLEAISESVSDILVILDKDGNVLKYNDTCKRFYDKPTYDYNEAVALAKFYDFDNNPLSMEDVPTYKVLKKGEIVRDFKFKVVKDGEEAYGITSGFPVLSPNGEVELGIFTTVDITDLMKKEKQIKEHKELLEAVIENIDDAIFIFDNDNNQYLQNRAAREYFPNTKLTKLGDCHENAEYFYFDNNPVPREEMIVAKVQKGQVIKGHELKMVQGNTIRYISVSGRPVYDSENNIKLSILHSRDITENVVKECLIKEQQELILKREIEKNEALEKVIAMKDEFLSMVSHELRTPLNVISAAVQAINYFSKDELSDRTKQYIGMIKQNTNRQLRLVNNLLDIIRADAGRISINRRNIDLVFLTRAIAESVSSYANQKGISLTFEASFEEKIVGTDDEKYERILLNLLSNAIKFTPGGKSVKVIMSSHKGNVCIKIKDDGVGIPEDKLEMIFERFGQVNSSLSRQAEGAGIGLSLVKKFVKVLGGNVSVESKVGKGSTFIIMLPDNKVFQESSEKIAVDFMENRLVEISNVEFSDIYL
jgi:PAS domain S-box-containing protein